MCAQVSSTALNLAIEEAPYTPDEPYSRSFESQEDQIYDYCQETLKIATQCANCEIFIRKLIRGYLSDRVQSTD